MTEHSPTPWRLGKNDGAVVCDDETLGPSDPESREHYGGRVVCESAMPGNAAFIALACNAHDELIAACEAARELYDLLALSPLAAAAKYGPDYEPPGREGCLAVRDRLEAALAEPEGK